jgi:hypothetical protein
MLNLYNHSYNLNNWFRICNICSCLDNVYMNGFRQRRILPDTFRMCQMKHRTECSYACIDSNKIFQNHYLHTWYTEIQSHMKYNYLDTVCNVRCRNKNLFHRNYTCFLKYKHVDCVLLKLSVVNDAWQLDKNSFLELSSNEKTILININYYRKSVSNLVRRKKSNNLLDC